MFLEIGKNWGNCIFILWYFIEDRFGFLIQEWYVQLNGGFISEWFKQKTKLFQHTTYICGSGEKRCVEFHFLEIIYCRQIWFHHPRVTLLEVRWKFGFWRWDSYVEAEISWGYHFLVKITFKINMCKKRK